MSLSFFNALTESRKTIFSAFGLEQPDAGALCDFYAAPFVHGNILMPEIRRLQERLEHIPEEGQLRTAHAQLHQMSTDLGFIEEALSALPDMVPCTEDLAGMVDIQLQGEKAHQSNRMRAAEIARNEVTADRAAFEQALAERIREADANCDRLASEVDALVVDQVHSLANTVLGGKIQSVSQAWRAFVS